VRAGKWMSGRKSLYSREIGDGADEEEKKQFSLAPQKRIKGNMFMTKSAERATAYGCGAKFNKTWPSATM